MICLELQNTSRHPMLNGSIRAVASLPFVESASGTYTHRPRSATLHTILGKSHLAVSCWCGMTILVSERRKNRLLDHPTPGRPMCASCEGRVIGALGVDDFRINERLVRYAPKQGRVAYA